MANDVIEPTNKWWQGMLKTYGSEEAVRLEMIRRQQRSMLNPNRQKGKHIGGFSDKKRASEAGKKGSAVRWANNED